MAAFLKLFIKVWIGLIALLNVLGLVGIMISTASFYETWVYVTETYSPFNVWTHGLNLVLLSPAYGAYVWLNKLDKA